MKPENLKRWKAKNSKQNYDCIANPKRNEKAKRIFFKQDFKSIACLKLKSKKKWKAKNFKQDYQSIACLKIRKEKMKAWIYARLFRAMLAQIKMKKPKINWIQKLKFWMWKKTLQSFDVITREDLFELV